MKGLPTAAMMICFLSAGVASAETSARPQPAASAPASRAEQQETNCATKSDVSSKEAKKQAKQARKQEKEAEKRARQAAEPESTQEAVEMGGGG